MDVVGRIGVSYVVIRIKKYEFQFIDYDTFFEKHGNPDNFLKNKENGKT